MSKCRRTHPTETVFIWSIFHFFINIIIIIIIINIIINSSFESKEQLNV